MALEAAGAAAITGGSLFQYNRGNFIYDRDMRQEIEYQVMDYRIQQADLWRDDVREIIGLTAVKMDTYLIVIAVEFGFAVMALLEGRMEVGTPRWLVGCYILSLGGACTYLLMAMWFGVHASVSAKSYQNRLLTQLVRPSMPTWVQLEGARTYASSFESLEPLQMFRVPFFGGSQSSVLRAPSLAAVEDAGDEMWDPEAARKPACSADPWGLEGRGDHIYELDGCRRTDPDALWHLALVREALPHWQSYDAFARAAMSVGTVQLVHALAYYVLGYVFLGTEAIFAAWFVIAILMFTTALLIRLDMSLTAFEYSLVLLLQVTGPCLQGFICMERLLLGSEDLFSESAVAQLAPLAYLSHAMYLVIIISMCKVETSAAQTLPTGFRSVMYIDIFGWLPSQKDRMPRLQQSDAYRASGPRPLDNSAHGAGSGNFGVDVVAGRGPGVEGVRYKDGLPVASRPEEQPGSCERLEGNEVPKDKFDPTSFVPKVGDVDQGRREAAAVQALLVPGRLPWKIFLHTTLLLIVLWCLVGFSVMLEIRGVTFFVVQPLLESPDDEKLFNYDEVTSSHAYPVLVASRRIASVPLRSAPRGIACGGGWAVVANPFGLLVGRLQLENASAATSFEAAPACSGVEGKEIEDVALQCADQGGEAGGQEACHAVVLLRHSRTFVRCSLPGADLDGGSAPLLTAPAMHVHQPVVGLEREQLTSVASTGACSLGRASSADGATCAYATTLGGRVVELREGPATSAWIVGRSVQVKTNNGYRHTSMYAPRAHDVSSRRPRVVAVGDKALLFDPESGLLTVPKPATSHGKSSAAARGWRLPDSHSWTAACGLRGGGLMALASGMPPELWHFGMPKEFERLTARTAQVASPVKAAEAALPTTPPSGARAAADLPAPSSAVAAAAMDILAALAEDVRKGIETSLQAAEARAHPEQDLVLKNGHAYHAQIQLRSPSAEKGG